MDTLRLMASILVIEDEPGLGRGLRDSLTNEGYTADWVTTAEQALDWLGQREAELLLVDVRLPGMNGIAFLSRLSDLASRPSVIVMTAHGDIRTAVEAMKAGAEEFLSKPIDLHSLIALVQRTIDRRVRDRALEFHKREAEEKYGLHRIIGRSPEIEKARELVRTVSRLGKAIAEKPPNILITGETGTGKDLLARAFHVEGPRAANPFVHVNCAALPQGLVESELFGHVKGAFTDARSHKIGLFEQANDGTLYLDELAQLPNPIQAKLLTAIETRSIRQVGGVDERPVRVQIIAAMNQPVKEALEAGTLRQDLFHRLRVLHAHLPPLRERVDDIEMLVEHFLAMHCWDLKVPPKQLSNDVRKLLRNYHWPGNIRELHHWLESAVLQADAIIEIRHLPPPMERPPAMQIASAARKPPRMEVDWDSGVVSLDDVERQLIQGALAHCGGNLTQAAKLLGLTRYAMRYRVAKHGLSDQEP